MTTVPVAEPVSEAGPVLLRNGFRVMFPAAALYAVVSVTAWILVLTGTIELPLVFDPLTWHVHEMLYGFVGAAIGGFLLTAVPNWTGRPPVAGVRLALVFGLWLAGRLAVTMGGALPPLAVLLVDLSYGALVLGFVARDIRAAGNKRNFVVIGLIAVFLAGLVWSHLDPDGAGHRLSLYAILVLIALIGGRVVPAFTGNWMRSRGAAADVRPFGPVDKATLAATVAAFAVDLAWPGSVPGAVLLIVAGGLHLLRLSGWLGWKSLGEPIVWVLHLGYLWLAIGLVLLGISAISEAVPEVAGLHALTAGAMATMILAIMTRAALGHSGRPLKASRLTVAAYVLVIAGAALRVAAAWMPGLLHPSATLWMLAFILYLVVYLPIVVRPRAGP